MQAIGEVFGGKLENLENVYHGVATKLTVIDADDLIYKNLPQHFEIGRYHSWVISRENFPEKLSITAIEENNQVMSLKHKDYQLYGVQYHPESILTEHGKEIINNFLEAPFNSPKGGNISENI
jgi:anthranilate synthase component 2